MNREIKFRGKPVDPSCHGFEFVHGYYYYDKVVDRHIIYDGLGSERVDVDPKTIGQYTGLKDSKRTKEFPDGEPLYKGDIISDDAKLIYVIKYSQKNTGFVAKYIFPVGYVGSHEVTINQHWIDEVTLIKIGNIHDNPELLNEQ